MDPSDNAEPGQSASQLQDQPERALPTVRHRVRRPAVADAQPAPDASNATAAAPPAEEAQDPPRKVNPDGTPIGYKNPPQLTRWQKGRSGNPRGRTKGSKNVKTIWEQRLNDRIKSKANGKTKTETALETIIRGRVYDAVATRDNKAIMHVFAEVARLGLFAAEEVASINQVEESDGEIAERFRLRGSEF